MSFEPSKWALYDAPSGNRIDDGAGDDEYFEELDASLEVLEVEGEWMKIKSEVSPNGWVRWKKDGILQFTAYYLM